MNLRAFTLLALLAALVHSSSTCFGQGTAFTYQGQFTDNTSPAHGTYDFQFTIYDALTEGNIAGGSLTNAPVAVSNGLFTVTLDFGAGVFTGADRWLEIGVRTNGGGAFTNLSPRQPITSAPYAIRAATFGGPVAATQITGTILSNNIGAGSITTVMLAANAVGSNQLALGAVTTGALADGAVTADKVAAVSNWFLVTFANPAPAAHDVFGASVAALGSDRFLIGAPGDDTGLVGGQVYLHTSGPTGTLLTNFANPTPDPDDQFGISVAAVGSDRVLIGALGDDTGAGGPGAAYLFRSDGLLLTTLTNPSPSADFAFFGAEVAAVGNGGLLVGAESSDTGATNAGVAYLFSTNGALLNTFTNPSPALGDNFGAALTGVGSDRVLVGAANDDTGATNAGVAYLFNTSSTLLITFTNPTPAANDRFGISVATMGSERVLIGAYQDNTGATDAGAAYLFNTNGILLTTFTNPVPSASAQFGISVAAVGSDRVLVGANFGGFGVAGAAYLFNTNGTLLATFSNPTPDFNDQFGISVAAVGSNQVVVGAYQHDTSVIDPNGMDAGAAYLFSLQTFTDHLVADAVRAYSVTSTSIEDGAVTASKLDPSIGVWTRSGNNVFRLTGNVGIGTNSFTSNRLQVAGMVGATAFNTASDRAAKANFTPVDPQAVLEKVLALPITRWNFKEMPGAWHVGPMAQDFRAAFGLGYDEKHIATVDADGVALAAIQGLNQKLEARGQKLEAENAELKKAVAELKEAIRELAGQKNGGAR